VWPFNGLGVLKARQGKDKKTAWEELRAFLFKKYDDFYPQSKVLNFAKGFLKCQAKLTLDPRYLLSTCFFFKTDSAEDKEK